jgi:hypothetical protein
MKHSNATNWQQLQITIDHELTRRNAATVTASSVSLVPWAAIFLFTDANEANKDRIWRPTLGKQNQVGRGFEG